MPVENTANVGLRKVLTRRQTTNVMKVLKDGAVKPGDATAASFKLTLGPPVWLQA